MELHIVFGDSAAGNLKQFFAKTNNIKNKIIVFHDNLSHGPICNLNCKKRILWYENILENNEYVSAKKLAKTYSDFNKFKIIKNKKYDIYIWIGPNSFDELGFLNICNSLSNKSNLFMIKFPKIRLKSKNGEFYTANSLGELPPEKITLLFKYKRKISTNKINFYSQLWKNISKNKSLLRIRKKEFIFAHKTESYYDYKIFKLNTKTYKSSAKVIGEILGKSRTKPDINFLLWRVRELIKKKKLEYEGNLSSMRYFKIKKSQKNK
jgi:hypothetical protein